VAASDAGSICPDFAKSLDKTPARLRVEVSFEAPLEGSFHVACSPQAHYNS